MSAVESEISEVINPTRGAELCRRERIELFNRLFREHNRSLMRFLVTRLRSVQEADDVAQESYVRLLELHQPGAVSLLRAYLFKTAANLAIDRLRRRAVRDRTSIGFLDEVSESPTVEGVVMARQEFGIVQAAVASLAPKTRQAFVLRVIDGISTPEVARRMGLKERMVREHVSRAMAECRRSLSVAEGVAGEG